MNGLASKKQISATVIGRDGFICKVTARLLLFSFRFESRRLHLIQLRLQISVKSITPKGKASVVVETESSKDGKLYDRTYRLKSLIPILSDRQIQIHQRLKSKGYAAETKLKTSENGKSSLVWQKTLLTMLPITTISA